MSHSPAFCDLIDPSLLNKYTEATFSPGNLMRYPVALLLMLGLTTTASANTFRLECIDANDGKTRLALIEVDTDAASIQIYSESDHIWKAAVNVSIAESTISYVERGRGDSGSVNTSVSIDRVTGKFFGYFPHSARIDGQCKKVPSDQKL
ncbi:MAG: hypothetical protein ABSF94_15175 [Steroidobacteraceae bacterium]